MARQKQDSKPSYVRWAIAFGVIALSLVLFKAGVFTSITNLWSDRARHDTQKAPDPQSTENARKEEQIRERVARDAAPAPK